MWHGYLKRLIPEISHWVGQVCVQRCFSSSALLVKSAPKKYKAEFYFFMDMPSARDNSGEENSKMPPTNPVISVP